MSESVEKSKKASSRKDNQSKDHGLESNKNRVLCPHHQCLYGRMGSPRLQCPSGIDNCNVQNAKQSGPRINSHNWFRPTVNINQNRSECLPGGCANLGTGCNNIVCVDNVCDLCSHGGQIPQKSKCK